MSRNLEDLTDEFRAAVETLLQSCEVRGFILRPFYTLRSPFEQAKLWRQSRSTEEIVSQIEQFRENDADFLAHCIESVGAQYGRHVTNVPPGFSWHQWGEAVDCFWLLDGKAEWSSRKKINGENGYHVYAEEAQNLGLEPGGFWQSFKDWPHVQLQNISNPGVIYSVQQINEEMRNKFEE